MTTEAAWRYDEHNKEFTRRGEELEKLKRIAGYRIQQISVADDKIEGLKKELATEKAKAEKLAKALEFIRDYVCERNKDMGQGESGEMQIVLVINEALKKYMGEK